jgi:hypothetical protein
MSGTIAAIVVAAVLALIAIVAMVGRKPRRSEWDAASAALGMEPIVALDPALTAAIISLHRPPVPDTHYEQKQTWSLTRIYRYPAAGVNCYSVTVHLEQTGEIWMHGATMRTESRETRVVALVAKETLQAPRMHLAPRAVVDPAAGALATMALQAANAVTDAAAEHSGDRVEFTDDPAFDRRYLVLSPQPLPARAFLDARRRRELAGLEDVQVSLEGSLLLVSSPTDAIRHRGRSLEESLRAELENARRALAVFDATAPTSEMAHATR